MANTFDWQSTLVHAMLQMIYNILPEVLQLPPRTPAYWTSRRKPQLCHWAAHQ